MTNAKLVRFNPPHQNAGSVSDQADQGNPGCDPAKNWFSKYPGTDVQKPGQTIDKGYNRQY
jgi:hypothetical protein